MTNLRVVTYNVWHNHAPLDQRIAKIVRNVSALHPDVVFFQEVEPVDSLAKQLSTQIGLPYVISTRPAAEAGFAADGLIILSRYPLQNKQVLQLPVTDLAGRSMLSATITVGLTAIGLHTLHTNYHPKDSAKRVQQITAALTAIGPSGVHILAGDFNATPETPEIALITNAGFVDVGPSTPTWSSLNPKTAEISDVVGIDRKIDYIFARGLPSTSGQIVLDKPDGTLWSSDHLGLMADFSVGGLTALRTNNALRGILIGTVLLGVAGAGFWAWRRSQTR